MQGFWKVAGFTLLELLVAIGLLGVLAVAAGPPLANFVDSARIRAAETDISTAMLYARTEAVRRRQNVYVKPTNGDWEQGWFVTTNASGVIADCGVSNTCLQVYQAHGVGVNDYMSSGQVTYTKDGRTNAYQLLIFCDANWSNSRTLSYFYLYPTVGAPIWYDCCICASFEP